MVRRKIPAGQVNRRNNQTIEQIKTLMEDLGQKYSIKVGILQTKGGSNIVPGTGLSMADLGAVHEFGANINHPGGQPYFINSNTGMAVFVSKNSFYGQYLISKGQVTKPHQINIPARSFLREPILGAKGRKEIEKAIENNIPEYAKDLEENTVTKIMDELVHDVAENALLQVQKAFYNDSIKPPTKEISKKMRKYNPQAPTLVDTGQLQKSISYEIKKV